MNDLNPDCDEATQTRPETQPQSYNSGATFHNQLDHITQAQHQGYQNNSPYVERSTNMRTHRATLPQTSRSHMHPSGGFPMLDGASAYRMPPHPMVSSQQEPYMMLLFNPTPSQMPMMARQPIHHFQPQSQYQQVDPYAFGMSPAPMTMLDAHATPAYARGTNIQGSGDFGQYVRRGPESDPVPSYPRGPPLKPKQSGYALWVGNLPQNTTVTDLKDHFSRDATNEIESLFWISKSKCAFVNYIGEAACVSAMNRFHGSHFHGVRLVCRLRGMSKPSSTTSPSLSLQSSTEPPFQSHENSSATSSSLAKSEEHPYPTIVGSEEHSYPTIVGSGEGVPLPTVRKGSAPVLDEGQKKIPEKFFIVKSLTTQDLEASVRSGTWTTQCHIEKALMEAYEKADDVYLVFSANKSGEYFGYARMTSLVGSKPVNFASTSLQAEPSSFGAPQSIVTLATATAPRGRIIDDSARGTIFWEAEQPNDPEQYSPVIAESESNDNQNWGRQFTIEWISIARLPFHRTRGLRNPWNAMREIKIARDGTEVEPSIGRRLIQMFHLAPQ